MANLCGAPLGEDLVAFRDSNGDVGLIDEFVRTGALTLFRPE